MDDRLAVHVYEDNFLKRLREYRDRTSLLEKQSISTTGAPGTGLLTVGTPANGLTFYGQVLRLATPGSDTNVIFNDGGVYGAESSLTFDKSTGKLYIGDGTASPVTGGLLDIVKVDTFETTPINLFARSDDGWGVLNFIRYRAGVFSILQDDVLGRLDFYGNANNTLTGVRARLEAYAAQDFFTGANGTEMALSVTDVGATTLTKKLIVNYTTTTIKNTLSMDSHKITNLTDPTSAQDAATKTYVDALVVGLWDDRGNFDASVNAYPSSGGSGAAGAILKGDIWTISVAGTLPTGQAVDPGDTVRALIDSPGNTQANWAIMQNNLVLPVSSANGGTGNNNSVGLLLTTNQGTLSFGAASKTLTINKSLTLDGVDGKILTLTGSLSVGADTSITGGGTLALGGFTATFGGNLSMPAAGAIGDLLVGDSTTAFSRLADVAAGQPLLSGGVGVAPAYAGYTFSGTTTKTYTFPIIDDTLAGLGTENIFTAKQAISLSSGILALRIRDNVIPDASLGTTDWMVASYNATSPSMSIISASSGSPGDRGVYKGVRARGTTDVPLVPNSGDQVVSLLGAIYDSATTQGTAMVNLTVDGAVSSGVAPQRIEFYTGATNAASRAVVGKFTSAGNFGVKGIIFPLADSTTALQFAKADMSTIGMTFDSTNLRLGIGTIAPSTPLHILSASAQVRIGYDVSNYATLQTDSTSQLTISSLLADITLNPASGSSINMGSPGNTATTTIQRLANATSGATTKNSNDLKLRGAYWNGSASAIVDSVIYEKVVDTTPKFGIAFKVNSVDRAIINSSGNLIVGATSDLTNGGKLQVVGSADAIQAIVKANATQTNNLMEWQNSSGTVKASMTGGGVLSISETLKIDSTTTLNDVSGFLEVANSAGWSGTDIFGTNVKAMRLTASLIAIQDGVNFSSNTSTGTKIGTATNQKWGFYNAAPIVQPGATTDLGTVLSNLGLRAAGTAYPITTAGAVTLARVYQSSGTAIAVGDVALGAGWGVNATVSTVTGNDQRGTITVTTSALDTPLATPVLTLTFHDGTWTTVPFAMTNMSDSGSGPLASSENHTTATTLVITYNGTPTALLSKTYIFNYAVIG